MFCKKNGFNLDIKNLLVKEEEMPHTTSELLELLHDSLAKSDTLLKELAAKIGQSAAVRG